MTILGSVTSPSDTVNLVCWHSTAGWEAVIGSESPVGEDLQHGLSWFFWRVIGTSFIMIDYLSTYLENMTDVIFTSSCFFEGCEWVLTVYIWGTPASAGPEMWGWGPWPHQSLCKVPSLYWGHLAWHGSGEGAHTFCSILPLIFLANHVAGPSKGLV